MKSFLVIGAGKFGQHLALELCRLGDEVMLVDKKENIIQELSSSVTTAEIGDYTVKANLEALGVEDFDCVFVCVGDFQSSLIIVDYLKELGARKIIAKATTLQHQKFLAKNGADQVVYPEKDVAVQVAVEYSKSSIFDYFKLNDEYGIYEIETPKSWVGKTLIGLKVRQQHGVTVIAVKDTFGIQPINNAEFIFSRNEHLIVMGKRKDIDKLI